MYTTILVLVGWNGNRLHKDTTHHITFETKSGAFDFFFFSRCQRCFLYMCMCLLQDRHASTQSEQKLNVLHYYLNVTLSTKKKSKKWVKKKWFNFEIAICVWLIYKKRQGKRLFFHYCMSFARSFYFLSFYYHMFLFSEAM